MSRKFDRLELEVARINKRVDKDIAFLREAGPADVGRAAKIMLRCCEGDTDPRIAAGISRLVMLLSA